MQSDQELCLQLHDDGDTFRVKLLPDTKDLELNGLQSKSKVHVEKVTDQEFDTKAMLLQLAIALKPHRGLKQIRFDDCCIDDFNHFCVALTHSDEPAVPGQPLFTLIFRKCIIEDSAAETLKIMLTSSNSIIGDLRFEDCNFEGESSILIEHGLSENTSLRSVECWFDQSVPTYVSPINGVKGMLDKNRNLVHLGLCDNTVECKDDDELDDDDNDIAAKSESFWNVFRSAYDNKSLQSLTIFESDLDLAAVETILMKCFTVATLRKLSFSWCSFTAEAFDFLVKTLSSNRILDSLILDNISDMFEPLNVSCGAVQVRTLGLIGTSFSRNTFPKLIDDIASNPAIEYLDLSNGTMERNADFRKICDSFLLQNRGPSELVLDHANDGASAIAEALKHYTSLRSLSIRGFSNSNLLIFIRGIAHMRFLRKLTLGFYFFRASCESHYQALLQSLEQNTSLRTLSLPGVKKTNEVAQRYLHKIRYFLAINRLGRDQVFTAPVPDGLWAHILAKTANEAVGINSILTGKPDIVTPSRKRKHCDEIPTQSQEIVDAV